MSEHSMKELVRQYERAHSQRIQAENAETKAKAAITEKANKEDSLIGQIITTRSGRVKVSRKEVIDFHRPNSFLYYGRKIKKDGTPSKQEIYISSFDIEKVK